MLIHLHTSGLIAPSWTHEHHLLRRKRTKCGHLILPLLPLLPPPTSLSSQGFLVQKHEFLACSVCTQRPIGKMKAPAHLHHLTICVDYIHFSGRIYYELGSQVTIKTRVLATKSNLDVHYPPSHESRPHLTSLIWTNDLCPEWVTGVTVF